MRYRPDHKKRSHQRIVAEAADALRREGLRGATVEGVMKAAGLSHGGFYAHFGSKTDLVLAALAAAFAETRRDLFAGLESAADEDWLRQVVARYLGRAHRDSGDGGCPLPRLAGEIAGAGAGVRETAAEGLAEYARVIASHRPGSEAAGRTDAYALLALMVGGIALARAVPDPGLSDEILRTCRRSAQDLMARSARST